MLHLVHLYIGMMEQRLEPTADVWLDLRCAKPDIQSDM